MKPGQERESPGSHVPLSKRPGAPRLQGTASRQRHGPRLTSAAGAPVTSGSCSGLATGQQRPAFRNRCLQPRSEAQARRLPTAADWPAPAPAGPSPGGPARPPASSPAPGAPAHRGISLRQVGGKGNPTCSARPWKPSTMALADCPHPPVANRAPGLYSLTPRAFAHTAPSTRGACLSAWPGLSLLSCVGVSASSVKDSLSPLRDADGLSLTCPLVRPCTCLVQAEYLCPLKIRMLKPNPHRRC